MAHLARGEGAALLERFRRHLRDHRLPVTRQRDLVAQTVFLSDEHLSVEAIQKQLRERGEHVGTATIYRTLDVLVQSGLVRAHDFGEGFKRYEPLASQSHHEHLICLSCGKVVEFSSERLERMKALIAEEYGFRHHHHRLEIYGFCRECQTRDAVTLRPETF